MKWSTLAIALTVTVALVGPATAQQSLGDVAGSIKLKRPEGESVVIDRDSIAQSRRRPTGGTDIELLGEIIGDCLTEATALSNLAEETRDGTSFYRDPWRDRVEVVLPEPLDGGLEPLAGHHRDLAEGAQIALHAVEPVAQTAPQVGEVFAGEVAADGLDFV